MERNKREEKHIKDFELLLIDDLEVMLEEIEDYLKKLKAQKEELIYLHEKITYILDEYKLLKGAK